MIAKKKREPKGPGISLDRVQTLIAYVRDPDPHELPLPTAIRIEIYEALEHLADLLTPGAGGRPPITQRRLCARLLYEMVDVHGMEQKEVIHAALRLAGLPGTLPERDAVSRLYRKQRTHVDFLEIKLGPGLKSTIANMSPKDPDEKTPQ